MCTIDAIIVSLAVMDHILCHNSRKCYGVLLEVSMLCSFSLEGELFPFSAFPTST